MSLWEHCRPRLAIFGPIYSLNFRRTVLDTLAWSMVRRAPSKHPLSKFTQIKMKKTEAKTKLLGTIPKFRTSPGPAAPGLSVTNCAPGVCKDLLALQKPKAAWALGKIKIYRRLNFMRLNVFGGHEQKKMNTVL